jgi:hypothetical protein
MHKKQPTLFLKIPYFVFRSCLFTFFSCLFTFSAVYFHLQLFVYIFSIFKVRGKHAQKQAPKLENSLLFYLISDSCMLLFTSVKRVCLLLKAVLLTYFSWCLFLQGASCFLHAVLFTSSSCCLLLHAVLFTSSSCCLLLQAVVFFWKMMFTSESCCLLLQAAVYFFQLFCLHLSAVCLPLQAAVYCNCLQFCSIMLNVFFVKLLFEKLNYWHSSR